MNRSWQVDLGELVDANATAMIQLRRQLHQHPEPSGEEQKTSQFLFEQLQAAGFQVRLGEDDCGVIVDGWHSDSASK